METAGTVGKKHKFVYTVSTSTEQGKVVVSITSYELDRTITTEGKTLPEALLKQKNEWERIIKEERDAYASLGVASQSELEYFDELRECMTKALFEIAKRIRGF